MRRGRPPGRVPCSTTCRAPPPRRSPAPAFEAASRIEVVSFDDFDWFAYASPAITAVRNDASAIAVAAVRGLLALLRGEEAASRRVPTELVDRAPTA